MKVALSGEGGDELFGGYARHAGDKLSPLFDRIPRPAKSLALACASRLPGLHRPRVALYALCQPTETARLVNWFPLFNPDMKAALLTDDFVAFFAKLGYAPCARERLPPAIAAAGPFAQPRFADATAMVKRV